MVEPKMHSSAYKLDVRWACTMAFQGRRPESRPDRAVSEFRHAKAQRSKDVGRAQPVSEFRREADDTDECFDGLGRPAYGASDETIVRGEQMAACGHSLML